MPAYEVLRMRAEFEASESRGDPLRLGYLTCQRDGANGYLEHSIQDRWIMWQKAWAAARTPPLAGGLVPMPEPEGYRAEYVDSEGKRWSTTFADQQAAKTASVYGSEPKGFLYMDTVKKLLAQQAAQPRPETDYLEGVHIPKLREALTFLGCNNGVGEGEVGAKLPEYVNAITRAVLRCKELLRSASQRPGAGD